MRVVLTNEQDEVVGYKERSALNEKVDIFRASCLWVENDIREVLIAQRSLAKKSSPGIWGACSHGGRRRRRDI
jgi:isopentenyldiphosphate isomerase